MHPRAAVKLITARSIGDVACRLCAGGTAVLYLNPIGLSSLSSCLQVAVHCHLLDGLVWIKPARDAMLLYCFGLQHWVCITFNDSNHKIISRYHNIIICKLLKMLTFLFYITNVW